MCRIMLDNISDHLGHKIAIKGWVSRIRKLGSLAFVIIRDRSGSAQVVLENMDIEFLRTEDVIGVEGKVVLSGNAPGGFEIFAEEYHVISKATYDVLPFSMNRETVSASLDSVLDHRVLSIRNPRIAAVFKIQQTIAAAFREFFTGRQFTEIHTPKLVASGTEGGTELFTVDYFGKQAYLAQSPQLYKQMMVGAGLERVYEIGHVYRAEPHETSRHINEYVSMDLELGFIEDEQELMALETDFIKHLFYVLQTQHPREIALYGAELTSVEVIPQFTLYEALRILKDHCHKQSPPGNLDAEGEKLFSQYVKDKTGSDFVFITKYPAAKRPFYAMPDSQNNELTNSFDLLYKGLEITTGGQRIHNYNQLLANIKKHGINPEGFDFYLDVFKYGMPPHGGLAIGLERLTMKLLGLGNVREATLFPRDRKRIVP